MALTPKEKEQLAFLYRTQGLTFAQIAEQLGYAHPAAAKKAYSRAVRARPDELVQEDRALDLNRIDLLIAALWPAAMQGDHRSTLTLIKLLERRAKLLGLDQPTKIAPTTPDGEEPYEQMGDEEREARLIAMAQTVADAINRKS